MIIGAPGGRDTIQDATALTRRLSRFRMYYGSEFASLALDQWASARGVTLDFIRPGHPVENCFIESFNGKLRDECLNTHNFVTLAEARQVIEQWRVEYHTERPHRGLRQQTPMEYASSWTPEAGPASPTSSDCVLA